MSHHLVSHVKNPHLRSNNTLHVIGVIANPVRYQSRYRLFRQWVKEMLNTPNVKLHVVEAIYGDRSAECAPEHGEYSYKGFHVKSEIWLKENLINLGVRYLLPNDWRYMAWVDADVSFRHSSWATESIHQLQHYQIIQPWSDAMDLTFDGGVHKHFQSFGYYTAKRIQHAPSGNNPYGLKYGHTGFAWATTRYFYENVGKLMDFAILGAGDNHMAWACLGKVENTMNPQVTEGYKTAAKNWQAKAKYACGELVGYVPGRIEHHFHGPKTRRQYWSRWQILVKFKFDPLKDLKYDAQGIMKLKGKSKLEHAIMHYNRERMEDSIEQY